MCAVEVDCSVLFNLQAEHQSTEFRIKAIGKALEFKHLEVLAGVLACKPSVRKCQQQSGPTANHLFSCYSSLCDSTGWIVPRNNTDKPNSQWLQASHGGYDAKLNFLKLPKVPSPVKVSRPLS